ncbi:DUF4160 domain-containing protein [Sphingobium boeckii]
MGGLAVDGHRSNEPPHVHIDKGGASIKIWLDPVAPRTPAFVDRRSMA